MALKFNRIPEVVKVHVRAKLHQVKCSGSSVINSAFRTTVDFDREYIWNGPNNQQAENGFMTDDFLHVRQKTTW